MLFRKTYAAIVLLSMMLGFVIPPKSSLKISFSHVVNNADLVLDSSNYTNELGQDFTVSKFKYYVSNFRLIKTDGTEVPFNYYFLIDEEEVNSKKIALPNIPYADYQAISFTLGVDSLHNCSGVQNDALDPVNAMFWAWNTGYIFLKMEGYAPTSTTPGHFYEYHIGGFRAPNNCIRTITLPFEHGLKINSEILPAINIEANLAEILKSPTVIDFSKHAAVTDFHNATTIADNYADMFRIKNIEL